MIPRHFSRFSCVFSLVTNRNALLNFGAIWVIFSLFPCGFFFRSCYLIFGFWVLGFWTCELRALDFVFVFLWFCIIHLFMETTVLMLIRIWFGFWFTLCILIVCHWHALYYNLTLLFSLLRIPVFRGGKTVRIRFRCMKLLDWDFASWNRVLGNYSICGRVFF